MWQVTCIEHRLFLGNVRTRRGLFFFFSLFPRTVPRKRCHNGLKRTITHQVDLIERAIPFSLRCDILLRLCLIIRGRQTYKFLTIKIGSAQKKKSSANTSKMLLLYVILNLCIAGKLNKILMSIRRVFNLLYWYWAVWGRIVFAAKLNAYDYRG